MKKAISQWISMRNISEYIENVYSHKLENLEEVNKFLDAFKLSKLSHEDMN
jgi:hypothetical protein